MNSQDLETVIVDAARGQLVDTPELKEMLAHTSTCRECAARLADQRTLTAGLEQLAEVARNEQAPNSVEVAVRAAYRERILAPAQAASPLVPPARRWTRWSLAAAAAAAILAVLAVTSWRVAPTEPNKAQPKGGTEATTLAPESERPAEPRTFNLQPPAVPTDDSVAPNRRRNLGSYRAEQRKQLHPIDELGQGTTEKEIVTDFMPMGGSDLFPIDSGSVVRVELPRSALESFGLPMNMERAGERIKADVVVGNDGLARAIRFVR